MLQRVRKACSFAFEEANMQKKNLYYTHDHEWIDYQGSVAYVGVGAFKLKGILQVEEIVFSNNEGSKKKGDIIATLLYDDYQILVHMPVDGKVIGLNEVLLSGDRHLLLRQPEKNGWIALIVPDNPKERQGLILPDQYKFNASTNTE